MIVVVAERANPRSGGWTLLEVVITMALLSVISIGLWFVVNGAQTFFGDEVEAYALGDMERRLVTRLEEELRTADASTIQPPMMVNSPAITFQRVEGFQNGARVLSTPIRITFLANQGTIVRAQDGQTIVWAVNVGDFSLSTTATGIDANVATVHTDSSGYTTTRALTRKIRFRN